MVVGKMVKREARERSALEYYYIRVCVNISSIDGSYLFYIVRINLNTWIHGSYRLYKNHQLHRTKHRRLKKYVLVSPHHMVLMVRCMLNQYRWIVFSFVDHAEKIDVTRRNQTSVEWHSWKISLFTWYHYDDDDDDDDNDHDNNKSPERKRRRWRRRVRICSMTMTCWYDDEFSKHVKRHRVTFTVLSIKRKKNWYGFRSDRWRNGEKIPHILPMRGASKRASWYFPYVPLREMVFFY